MRDRLTVALPSQMTPLVAKTVDLLSLRLAQRGGPPVIRAGKGETSDLILELRPEFGAEGFSFAGECGEPARIIGNDERGLLYGAGKFLRTCSFAGEFAPSAWRGVSRPDKPLRGMYFATHFHNWYHLAPLPDITRYIEDLALWGCNALEVWFDMHHYAGIDDPAAQDMIARLRAILQAAQAVGMRPALGILVNEGYATTPPELRATPTGRSHYGCEICPSTPAGEALMLRIAEERFAAFADCGVELVSLWPYDQGGCSCPDCAPWGARGMLQAGEKVARLAKRHFPQAEMIFSTWLFDYGGEQGEWRGLSHAFAERPEWVDYLMVDSHEEFPVYPLRHGVPGGLPMINFPEISMWGMYPWGGFGATPLPRRFQRLWAPVKDRQSGGFPYSEGIFEDQNKVMYAGFYWTGGDSVDDAIAEYARYELGCEDHVAVQSIVDTLEANHGACWYVNHPMPEADVRPSATITGFPGARRVLMPGGDAARAAEANAVCQQLDSRLPAWARHGWRWRLLFLRALIDDELLHHDGDATPACLQAFDELVRLYHLADPRTLGVVNR